MDKKVPKKVTSRSTPWKRNSWFLFLDNMMKAGGACMSTSREVRHNCGFAYAGRGQIMNLSQISGHAVEMKCLWQEARVHEALQAFNDKRTRPPGWHRNGFQTSTHKRALTCISFWKGNRQEVSWSDHWLTQTPKKAFSVVTPELHGWVSKLTASFSSRRSFVIHCKGNGKKTFEKMKKISGWFDSDGSAVDCEITFYFVKRANVVVGQSKKSVGQVQNSDIPFRKHFSLTFQSVAEVFRWSFGGQYWKKMKMLPQNSIIIKRPPRDNWLPHYRRSRRNYAGGFRSWPPATCTFSTWRSFHHHGKGKLKNKKNVKLVCISDCSDSDERAIVWKNACGFVISANTVAEGIPEKKGPPKSARKQLPLLTTHRHKMHVKCFFSMLKNEKISLFHFSTSVVGNGRHRPSSPTLATM